MKFKFIIIFIILLGLGCRNGLRPIKMSQLSGRTIRPVVTNIVNKQLEVKIPATTNTYKVDILKLETNKSQILDLQVITQPQIIKLDIQEKSWSNPSNGFLLLYYGTLFSIMVIGYFLIKTFKRNKTHINNIPRNINPNTPNITPSISPNIPINIPLNITPNITTPNIDPPKI